MINCNVFLINIQCWVISKFLSKGTLMLCLLFPFRSYQSLVCILAWCRDRISSRDGINKVVFAQTLIQFWNGRKTFWVLEHWKWAGSTGNAASFAMWLNQITGCDKEEKLLPNQYQKNMRFNFNRTSEAAGIADHVTLLQLSHYCTMHFFSVWNFSWMES